MRRRGVSIMGVALSMAAVGILTAVSYQTAAASYNEFRQNDCKVKLGAMREAISAYRYRYYRNSTAFAPAPMALGWPTAATLTGNSYTYTDGIARTVPIFAGGVPIEPFSGSNTVTGTFTGTGGWFYEPAWGGYLIPNLDDTEYGPGGSKANLSEWPWEW